MCCRCLFVLVVVSVVAVAFVVSVVFAVAVVSVFVAVFFSAIGFCVYRNRKAKVTRQAGANVDE